MQDPNALRRSRIPTVALLVMLNAACSTLQDGQPAPATPPAPTVSAATDCRIIYDAGSGGTRLYIYRQTRIGWEEHKGPEVAALADPVREIRDKTWNDADKVVSEVVAALPAMLKDAPLKDGQRAWQGFDWRNLCNVVSASIFATAGMRIAEQTQRSRSADLWRKLKQELTTAVGQNVAVSVRTLSGFEEGLFTWLALAETSGTSDFGIAEMGGASAQVTYPCPQCDPKSDRVRTIDVGGQPVQFFSYSFLGLGTYEAPRTLGFPMSCRYGIGKLNPSWKVEHCVDRIRFSNANGYVYDPYNFSNGAYGIDSKLPTRKSKVEKWYLTGAFAYMKDDDVARCCATEGSCYEPETACFVAVYLRKYLSALKLANTEFSRASWTKGANLCLARNCLARAHPAPLCRWSDQGCLAN